MSVRNEMQGIRSTLMGLLVSIPNDKDQRSDLVDAWLELAYERRLQRLKEERRQRVVAMKRRMRSGQITEGEYNDAIDGDPDPAE